MVQSRKTSSIKTKMYIFVIITVFVVACGTGIARPAIS